jgi:hypothetical protein
LVNNPVFYKKSKHIGVCFYYIRELIKNSQLDLIYMALKDQKTDGLIKVLDSGFFNNFIKYLNLKK